MATVSPYFCQLITYSTTSPHMTLNKQTKILMRPTERDEGGKEKQDGERLPMDSWVQHLASKMALVKFQRKRLDGD